MYYKVFIFSIQLILLVGESHQSMSFARKILIGLWIIAYYERGKSDR